GRLRRPRRRPRCLVHLARGPSLRVSAEDEDDNQMSNIDTPSTAADPTGADMAALDTVDTETAVTEEPTDVETEPPAVEVDEFDPDTVPADEAEAETDTDADTEAEAEAESDTDAEADIESAEAVGEGEAVEGDDPWTRPGEWYVVHTQSGYEK